jgi:hypothetical protein
MKDEKSQDCEVIIDTRWQEILEQRGLFRGQWQEILEHGTALDQYGNRILVFGKIHKISLKSAVVLLDHGLLFEFPLKYVRIVETKIH